MNLKITTSTPLSIGGSNVTNIVGTLNTSPSLQADGTLLVKSSFNWWINATAKTEGKENVWIVGTNGNKITDMNVVLTAEEAGAAGLPLTIYTKVAEALESANEGMTVIVEN
jgi:hypothetical protein